MKQNLKNCGGTFPREHSHPLWLDPMLQWQKMPRIPGAGSLDLLWIRTAWDFPFMMGIWCGACLVPSMFAGSNLNIKMRTSSNDTSKIRSWAIGYRATCIFGIWPPQVWKCPESDPLGASHHGLSGGGYLGKPWWKMVNLACWEAFYRFRLGCRVLLQFRSSSVLFAICL